MARKRSHFCLLLFCLFLPLAVGLLAGSLTRQQVASYATMPKPSFAPPGIVFPIVWNILYLLMGYSSYLVARSASIKKHAALSVYSLQLLCNFFWPLIFFNLQAYLAAFLWLVTLFLLVLYMAILFFDISRPTAYLQIPYLLWLLFAGVLNFCIWLGSRV